MAVAETVNERLARLLALVPWLSARQGITLTEAARHFDITVEQLTKDLWQLVVCGLPGYGPDQLVDIDFWDDDRIWVQDPQTLTAPLRLTAEEGAALSVALRLISQIPGVEYREDIAVLVAKLDEACGATSEFVQLTPQTNQEFRDTIDAALAGNVQLAMTYSSGSDEVTERRVSPIRVFVVDDYMYLEGYCERAEARRIFRLDRILSIEMTKENAPPPQHQHNHLPASGGLDSWFVSKDSYNEIPRALVQVDPESSWVAEEPYVEVISHEPLTISVPYLTEDWLLSWVMSLGGSMQLLEPRHLTEEIAQNARASLAALSARD
jgi:predicted DNA-binding transcriptional regulator YafY